MFQTFNPLSVFFISSIIYFIRVFGIVDQHDIVTRRNLYMVELFCKCSLERLPQAVQYHFTFCCTFVYTQNLIKSLY